MERVHWSHRGLDLSYLLCGPPDGPVVIVLHGYLDTAEAFTPIALELADRWRVIVPDHRGHGQSGHVSAGGYYHFADYLLDLDGLYAELGTREAVLVGHSMGGSIGCYFAGTFPERVRGLVLLDGIGPPLSVKVEDAPERVRQWVADVRAKEGHQGRGAPDLDAVARSISRLSTRTSPGRLLDLARAATYEDDDGRLRWRFDPLHRTRAPMGFDAERFLAFLRRIACPTLALWAEQSPMHGPDEEERVAAIKGLTQSVVSGTGHNLHHERPEEVAQAIGRFLADLAR